MQASSSRELDKEIATKIFKLAVVAQDNDFYISKIGNFALTPVPNYSTDLDYAHLVLNSMRDQGLSYIVGSRIEGYKLIWVASFHPDGAIPVFSIGSSLSEAICLAALDARRKRTRQQGIQLVDSAEKIISIEDFKKK
jgi:hypothetical protein